MNQLKTIPHELFRIIAHYTWNKPWNREEIADLAMRIDDIQTSIPDCFKSYWYRDERHPPYWRMPNPLLSGQPFVPVDLTKSHWNRREVVVFLESIPKQYFAPKMKKPLYRHLDKPLYREWNKFYNKLRDLKTEDLYFPMIMADLFHNNWQQLTPAEQETKWSEVQAANLRYCSRFVEGIRFASVTLKPS